MKNMQGPMTLLGQRLENVWVQVYASGCIGGGTRGASVKELFVWTLLLMCDVAVEREEQKKRVEVISCDRFILLSFVGFLAVLAVDQKKSQRTLCEYR